MKKYSLKKSESIKNKKEISRLFKNGKFLFTENFKLLWQHKKNNTFSVKIVVSIPKNKIKKATERNLLRRRIKEAYRLNKHLLFKYQSVKEIKINLFFICISSKKISFKSIKQQVVGLLTKISEILQKENSF